MHRSLPSLDPVRAFVLLVPVLGLGLGLTRSAIAASTAVSASGYVSIDNGQTQYALNQTTTPTANGGQTVAASRDINLSTTTGPTSLGYVTGFATADPGGLHEYVHGYAAIVTNGSMPTFTNGTPRVNAQFGASFDDVLHLTSATLPVGTSVTFTVTIDLNATTNGVTHIVGNGFNPAGFSFDTNLNGSEYGATFPNGFNQDVPKSLQTNYPQTFTMKVGDSFYLAANMSVSSDNRAGFYDGTYFNYGDSSETIVDASHSLDLFADPNTPGLTITSDSGHNYATAAVPEPTSLAALALATLALPIRRRTRTRRI